MELPVYLFTGFLSAGKTKFIADTLADERFHKGERTLLLVCEQGEEEYDPQAFAAPNVYLELITEQENFTTLALQALCDKHKPERVILEYHGMWNLSMLWETMPQNWVVVQNFCFFETATALVYNANLRSLVVDKLQSADLVVFNRMEPDCDVMPYHKMVRGVSRSATIIYDRADGTIQQDDIEDPLPFDINAPLIEIADTDYAIWYRDLSEELQKYDGKTVAFLANVAKNSQLGKNALIVGRRIMTCCIDDIRFAGLICEGVNADAYQMGDWVKVTATVHIKNHSLYGRKGPVLKAKELVRTSAPMEEVVTF